MGRRVTNCCWQKNVYVLLAEDMHQDVLWYNLDQFISSGCLADSSQTYPPLQTRNVSRKDNLTWQIRPFRRHFLKKYLKAKVKKSQLYLISYIVINVTIVVSPLFDYTLFLLFNIKRNSYIYLNQAVKEKIHVYVWEYNTNLSFKLNRDLTKLGY